MLYIPVVLIMVAASSAAYIVYFRNRAKASAAGGWYQYQRQELEKALGLAGTPERATAGWSASTVPEGSLGRDLALAVINTKVVGRPLILAFTTGDRLFYADLESRDVIPLTRGMVRITDTGYKGSKTTDQEKWGFQEGRILRLDFPDGQGFEIDIIATAASTLLAWAQGASVAGMDGPYPPRDRLGGLKGGSRR